jgi:hypothetical protein
MRKTNKQKYSRRKRGQQNMWLPIGVAMGGVLLIAVAFLVWGSGLLGDSSGDAGGTPLLVVDQEVIDFGEVKYNQVVQASFQITNVGEGTLQFTEVPYIEVVEGC